MLCPRTIGTLTIALGLAMTATTSELAGQQKPKAGTAAEQPLRVIGEIPAWLERASRQDGDTMTLTLFLDGVQQAIDRGDQLRIFDPATDKLLATAEVTRNTRTVAASGRVHVRARIAEPKRIGRITELAADRHAELPKALAARNPFVTKHGAKVTVVLPFEPEKGDAPRNFVRIVDKETGKASLDADHVPVHASFVVRFNKPIDLATINRMEMTATHAKGIVPLRVFTLDSDDKSFRFEPPLGLAFTPQMRKIVQAAQAGERPIERHYSLRIRTGDKGVRAGDGEAFGQPFNLGIRIDPNAKDNIVGWHNFAGR